MNNIKVYILDVPRLFASELHYPYIAELAGTWVEGYLLDNYENFYDELFLHVDTNEKYEAAGYYVDAQSVEQVYHAVHFAMNFILESVMLLNLNILNELLRTNQVMGSFRVNSNSIALRLVERV